MNGAWLTGNRRGCRARAACANSLRSDTLRPAGLDTRASQGAPRVAAGSATGKLFGRAGQAVMQATADRVRPKRRGGPGAPKSPQPAPVPGGRARPRTQTTQADPTPNCQNVLRLGAALQVPSFAAGGGGHEVTP